MRPARPVLMLLALCSILVGAAGLPPAPAPAQSAVRTLSALQPLGGTVRQVQIAGDRAVYLADFEIFGHFDLYSAPLAGGPVTLLSADLPAGVITQYLPAGAVVVVDLQLDSTAQHVLFSVPLLGGPATPLTEPPAAPAVSGRYPDLAIAGPRLVYRLDHEAAWVGALYSVPLAGGPITRLSDPQDGDVRAMHVSADGGTVAYLSAPANGPAQISTMAPDGSDRARLSGATPSLDFGAAGFALTPDGGRVVYRSANVPSGLQVLWSVERDGQNARPIAQRDNIPFLLTPDGAQVVYTALNAGAVSGPLSSAPLDGGEPRLLAPNAAPGLLISPDSAAVYVPEGGGLRRFPLDGGASAQLVPDAGACGVRQPTFTASGRWLVFLACVAGLVHIYSYDTAGSDPAFQIDHLYVPGGLEIKQMQVTGEHIVYSIGEPVRPEGWGGAYAGSYLTPASHQSLAPIRSPDPAFVPKWRSIMAATGGHVVYQEWSAAGPQYLNHVIASSDGSSNAIDAGRAVDRDVRSFMLSPADGAALYLADQDRQGLPDLYRVPIAGGPPVRLNEPMSSYESGYTEIAQVFPAPAGGWVLYEMISHNYYSSAKIFSLWSAPVGGPPTEIMLPCDGRNRREVVFSPDGTTAVIHCAPELFRIPLGGKPVATIDTADSPPLGPLAQISPDGAHVVYVASVGTPREIRSAPLAGGPPVTLGPITAGPFQISPDSRLVVYAQPIIGLVAQPLDGGSATLLPLLGPGETLGDWAITPDGAAIIAAVRSAAGPALRRLPLAGGPATTLATAEAGATMRFTLPPQTDRALFTVARPGAGAGVPPAHTLLSVPLAGGPPAPLYGPFPSADFSLADVAVSPDGAIVTIRADAGLFAVATAGGAVARLDDPADPAAIAAFAPTADGRVAFIEGGALLLSDRYGALRQRLDGAHPDRVAQAFEIAGGSVVFLGETFFQRSSAEHSVRELFAADLPPVVSLLRVVGAGLRLPEADRSPAVEVALAAPQPRTVTVPYRVSGGTARAGVDYQLAAGPLVFAPGETRKRLPLTLLPRPGFQGRRTLTLSLTDPSPWANDAGATVAPAVVVVPITITDEAGALMLPLVGR